MKERDPYLLTFIGVALLLGLVANLQPDRDSRVEALQRKINELESASEERDNQVQDYFRDFVQKFEDGLAKSGLKMRSLAIVDESGNTRIQFLTKDGGSHLAFFDANKKGRLNLSLDADGNSVIRHFDRNGVVRADSGVAYPEGNPGGISFFIAGDADGKPIKGSF